jgi:hypothetical protein
MQRHTLCIENAEKKGKKNLKNRMYIYLLQKSTLFVNRISALLGVNEIPALFCFQYSYVI